MKHESKNEFVVLIGWKPVFWLADSFLECDWVKTVESAYWLYCSNKALLILEATLVRFQVGQCRYTIAIVLAAHGALNALTISDTALTTAELHMENTRSLTTTVHALVGQRNCVLCVLRAFNRRWRACRRHGPLSDTFVHFSSPRWRRSGRLYFSKALLTMVHLSLGSRTSETLRQTLSLDDFPMISERS
jgi:hypothetical protein